MMQASSTTSLAELMIRFSCDTQETMASPSRRAVVMIARGPPRTAVRVELRIVVNTNPKILAIAIVGR
jgi:hypothetical protein